MVIELIPIRVVLRLGTVIHRGHVREPDAEHASAYPVCVARCDLTPAGGALSFRAVGDDVMEAAEPGELCPAWSQPVRLAHLLDLVPHG